MYRRNLPHWHPPGAVVFVTWRLAGSLPVLDRSCRDGRIFVHRDRLLDHASQGSTWLREPRVAECVMNCICRNSDDSYALHAFVIMPNHVHILITPRDNFGQNYSGP